MQWALSGWHFWITLNVNANQSIICPEVRLQGLRFGLWRPTLVRNEPTMDTRSANMSSIVPNHSSNDSVKWTNVVFVTVHSVIQLSTLNSIGNVWTFKMERQNSNTSGPGVFGWASVPNQSVHLASATARLNRNVLYPRRWNINFAITTEDITTTIIQRESQLNSTFGCAIKDDPWPLPVVNIHTIYETCMILELCSFRSPPPPPLHTLSISLSLSLAFFVFVFLNKFSENLTRGRLRDHLFWLVFFADHPRRPLPNMDWPRMVVVVMYPEVFSGKVKQ